MTAITIPMRSPWRRRSSRRTPKSVCSRGRSPRSGFRWRCARYAPFSARIGLLRLRGRRLPSNKLCATRSLGGREHHSVVGAAVAVGEHAADRVIALRVHAHRFAIPQLVADVKVDAFAHAELAIAVHMHSFPDLA